MSAVTLADEEGDLAFEEELIRDPHKHATWWNYLELKKDSSPKFRNVLFERALQRLPGSYKLWYNYLLERQIQVRGRCPSDPAYEALNDTFERAIVFMSKMPRVWMEYVAFLTGQRHLINRTRKAFDHALQSLPITQHSHIWPLYIKFARQCGVVDTALRVYRRYLKLQPDAAEEFVEYLLAAQRYDEAAAQLAKAVNSEDFVSRKGKSKHEVWQQLCDLLSTHPEACTGLRAEAIIRSGIRKFTDETGKLWTSLANYHIRLGGFERARDVFEESMCTVTTVRDFAIVFDAYTQFEEGVVAAAMENMDEENDEDAEELELRLAFLEHLTDRRPVLLSSVMLRQNPHNVHEWHKRVQLFKDNPQKMVLTYTEAVKTVKPHEATGKPHTLWCAFAKFYEKHGDVGNARVIYEKTVTQPFKGVDDLASVWCEYAEMELRARNVDGARDLLTRATREPAAARRREKLDDKVVQERVHRSTKLWCFYVDLEESYGTVKSTSDVYDRVLDLKVATPQMVINYARFLTERKYFEESFKAYERGVATFTFPHSHDIWIDYLNNFVKRYGGRKLERARDLFEQAIEKVPADVATVFYLLYAALEEEYGLVRHATSIYERATKAVDDEHRFEMYQISIKKAAEYFGVTRTRSIYERAIQALNAKNSRIMCLQYADLERRLGEIDRSRAIFCHCAQFCDPRTEDAFWSKFNDFEVHHGNEDTFREMLRLKRSVTAQFTEVSLASGDMMRGGDAPDPMAGLEGAAEANANRGTKRKEGDVIVGVGEAFLKSETFSGRKEGYDFKSGEQGQGYYRQPSAKFSGDVVAEGKGPMAPIVENNEEIELDDDDSESDDDEPAAKKMAVDGAGDEINISTSDVPAAVFGDALLQSKKEAADDVAKLGALARMKRGR